jgi:hypothetical protein
MAKQAAYLNVGDKIFYGKYKNKKGIIVKFDKDEKGDPTIEVEPVPKGKKKNKIIKFLKVRKMALSTPLRVALRFLAEFK